MIIKLNRIIASFMLCSIGFTAPVFAETQIESESLKARGPIFMGKVMEVEEKDKDSNVRIRVKGYIKGCEVYEEEIFAIITKDTKVMTSSCNEEKKCEDKKSQEEIKKCENCNIDIKVSDTVFICLDEIMTKSIPPQVVAKRIQITRVKS